MPMKTKISYACVNAVGKIRKNNEDNFYAQGRFRGQEEVPDLSLGGSFPADGKEILAVFDGMGGEDCGEVASYLAAAGVGTLNLTEKDPKEETRGAIRILNRKVCEYAEANGIGTMGCTAVLYWFGKKKCYVSHVGDSRAYLFRKKELSQLTADHAAPPMGRHKGALMQFLGLPEKEYLLEPGFRELEYKNGDLLLLCSDGLTDMVTDDEMKEILCKGESVEKTVELLCTKALENGGRDNVTIILAKIQKNFF